MLETIRRYVEAGREALTPKKAEELARSLVKQGQAGREQASRVARDLLQWSRKNSERLGAIIQREVKKQVANLGVATKDEVSALKRRVRELEKGSGGRRSTTRGSSKSTAKRSSAKRTPRKA
jgi:polyhydroxyalkanoate synthesis regulator phasin